MDRRQFLMGATSTIAGAALPMRSTARAASASVLKYIPSSNLTILDPIANTHAATRLHGFMVFDMLYGLDANFQPQPQMAKGHEVSADNLNWKITLRENQRFHDGEPVLARDVVASIKRWGQRDAYGQLLLNATNELNAVGDDVVEFRLKTAFPLLPAALGKVGSFIPAIMPERIALTDATQPATEIVGSGPFEFLADEFSPGAFAAYRKFADYVPGSGEAGLSSGAKVVNFDRIEWHTIPDQSTALAAMQTGEMDWWEAPLPDFLPLLEASGNVTLVPSSNQVFFLRLNHLHPPFDNPQIRRLVLHSIDRTSVMQAAGGAGTWHTDVGIYTGSMATDAGIAEAFQTRTDFDAVKSELAAAGYNGEPVVMIVQGDIPMISAAAQVVRDTLTKCGFNVDYQSLESGTVSQRRTSMEPTDAGGWSGFITFADSEYFLDQATNFIVRANGKKSWFGWPDSPRIEELNQQWFAATDLDAQREIARQIQLQAWQDVPYIPLGELQQRAVASASLSGFAPGFTKFWNVRRS